MTYLAIVAVQDNRIAKFAKYQTQAEADAHSAEHGGFAFHNSEGWAIPDMWVDGQTVTNQPRQPEPRRTGSAREFMSLFTDTEKAAILTASKANVQIELWLTEAMAGSVSLDHPTMAPALASLEQSGVLASGRADVIIATDFNA